MRRRHLFALLGLGLLLAIGFFAHTLIRPSEHSVSMARELAPPASLAEHCRAIVGSPRIEAIGEHVLVALGYDLANTILVRTAAGNVVIDAGMSPARAREVRAALSARAPGPIAAIIYTHSHIDHVGGASVWVDPETAIWATDAFGPHFIKQYSELSAAEARRGQRQFGAHVPESSVPCSALGRRADFDGAARTGARMPTRTFSGRTELTVGGVRFELVEAHGETHDQLFVYLPDHGVLMPGDNYYHAFPNLYTIRGTSPRPVDQWIRSLDAMRRRAPEHLVPSHTQPLHGREAVSRALTRYRDAIQWVRDRVVALANEGLDVDAMAERIGLPPSLEDEPALRPMYGQVDWSVRALYTNQLGWFDERPERLYPLASSEESKRRIALMGGEARLWSEIEKALEREPGWALSLLAELDHAGLGERTSGSRWALAKARALEQQAARVGNSNGRAYLLESAHELRSGLAVFEPAAPDDLLLDAIPLESFFRIMAARLIPERAHDVHEAARFEFTDTKQRFTVTVRHGVAEVVEGDPLPGTPAPLATITTTSATWRRIATELENPLVAVASGQLSLVGDPAGFYRFVERFRRGL